MPTFCQVTSEVRVENNIVKSKFWSECDVMKTGVTRAWTKRQFNLALKSAPENTVVRAELFIRYGESHGNMSIKGWISGVNGHTMSRRGIFEE